MALLRKIFDRNPNWRRNNRPHVEPTDEQKELERIRKEKLYIASRRTKTKLACMMATMVALGEQIK